MILYKVSYYYERQKDYELIRIASEPMVNEEDTINRLEITDKIKKAMSSGSEIDAASYLFYKRLASIKKMKEYRNNEEKY